MAGGVVYSPKLSELHRLVRSLAQPLLEVCIHADSKLLVDSDAYNTGPAALKLGGLRLIRSIVSSESC